MDVRQEAVCLMWGNDGMRWPPWHNHPAIPSSARLVRALEDAQELLPQKPQPAMKRT